MTTSPTSLSLALALCLLLTGCAAHLPTNATPDQVAAAEAERIEHGRRWMVASRLALVAATVSGCPEAALVARVLVSTVDAYQARPSEETWTAAREAVTAADAQRGQKCQ